MYLVVIAWLYVAVMMSVAEATGTNGSLLGAIVTFFLYGLIPLALVVYLMLTPQRRKGIREREAAEEQARFAAGPPQGESAPVGGSDPRSGGAWGSVFAAGRPSDHPDAGGHATGAAESGGVAPVGKEP